MLEGCVLLQAAPVCNTLSNRIVRKGDRNTLLFRIIVDKPAEALQLGGFEITWQRCRGVGLHNHYVRIKQLLQQSFCMKLFSYFVWPSATKSLGKIMHLVVVFVVVV